jgi:hypothetical protein
MSGARRSSCSISAGLWIRTASRRTGSSGSGPRKPGRSGRTVRSRVHHDDSLPIALKDLRRRSNGWAAVAGRMGATPPPRIGRRGVSRAETLAVRAARLFSPGSLPPSPGIVSNFYGNLLAAGEGGRRHFSAAIDSVDVGCVKLDPGSSGGTDALEPARRRHFVGLSGHDMAGARALGMGTSCPTQGRRVRVLLPGRSRDRAARGASGGSLFIRIGAGESSWRERRPRRDGRSVPKPLVPVGGVTPIEPRSAISSRRPPIRSRFSSTRGGGLRASCAKFTLALSGRRTDCAADHPSLETSRALAAASPGPASTVDAVPARGLRALRGRGAPISGCHGLAVTRFVDDERLLWVWRRRRTRDVGRGADGDAVTAGIYRFLEQPHGLAALAELDWPRFLGWLVEDGSRPRRGDLESHRRDRVETSPSPKVADAHMTPQNLRSPGAFTATRALAGTRD